MTAVLLESRTVHSGSWTNIPNGASKLVVKGMETGDALRIGFWSRMQQHLTIDGDQEVPLPEDCKRVKVSHIKASGNPVSVDLER